MAKVESEEVGFLTHPNHLLGNFSGEMEVQ
jgi:hypothetical protein